MPIIAGIDEAGYGPTLGPLVVAMSVWRVADGCENQNLWSILKKTVSAKRNTKSASLHVADSKEVFDRKVGIASLERGVLAFAAAIGVNANDFLQFLEDTAALGTPRPALPWYEKLQRPLPIDPKRGAFSGISAQLRRTMEKTNCCCHALRTRLVDERFYNRRVEMTRNKSAVVVEQVLALIQQAAEIAGPEALHITVDRLGGRAHYREILQSAFPDRTLEEIEHSPTCSAYRLIGSGGVWEISFRVGADKNSLPVALASMCAKYTREVVMMGFNEFWRGHAHDLAPTAGYYQDAQRFLTDIQAHLGGAKLKADEFVRLR